MLLYLATPLEPMSAARRIPELREQHRRGITEHLGRARRQWTPRSKQLYEQPILSVKDVRALIGTTFAGVNQIVQRLVDLKILAEITGQARHRRFRYDAYVRLFDEE